MLRGHEERDGRHLRRGAQDVFQKCPMERGRPLLAHRGHQTCFGLPRDRGLGEDADRRAHRACRPSSHKIFTPALTLPRIVPLTFDTPARRTR